MFSYSKFVVLSSHILNLFHKNKKKEIYFHKFYKIALGEKIINVYLITNGREKSAYRFNSRTIRFKKVSRLFQINIR